MECGSRLGVHGRICGAMVAKMSPNLKKQFATPAPSLFSLDSPAHMPALASGTGAPRGDRGHWYQPQGCQNRCLSRDHATVENLVGMAEFCTCLYCYIALVYRCGFQWCPIWWIFPKCAGSVHIMQQHCQTVGPPLQRGNCHQVVHHSGLLSNIFYLFWPLLCLEAS